MNLFRMVDLAVANVLGSVDIVLLSKLWENIRTNWLAPLFFAAVAVFAIMFIKDRKWTQLISFIGIAAVVGVLIFAGQSLLGDGKSGLTGTGAELGGQVGKSTGNP